MFAKQLTVFLENREGRLSEALAVLGKNKVNILSVSLADTTEFGLLRLIVDNATLGKEKLSEEGFSSLLSDVLIVEISHSSGSLQKLLEEIGKEGVNIEYMYGMSIESKEAHIVIKASDVSKVEEILAARGVKTLSCEDLAKM